MQKTNGSTPFIEGTEQDQQVEESTCFNEDNEQQKSQKTINYENIILRTYLKIFINLSLSQTDVNTMPGKKIIKENDKLLSKGIQPVVTISHYELP